MPFHQSLSRERKQIKSCNNNKIKKKLFILVVPNLLKQTTLSIIVDHEM